MSLIRKFSRRALVASGAAFSAAIGLAACAPPGSDGGDASAPLTGDPTCGEDAVVLSAYFETGFPLARALTDEFTRQYPNITFDIREDQFAVITQNAPRTLQDSPPDLMRLPQMSELATDGLLLDLDPYAEAFGWDAWPASQLEQMRVAEDGSRGDGPLYAMGLGYSMTGVFYNKELGAQIGMAEPPATLEEFDGYLAAARDAGITPVAQFNGGATGGLAFPLQALMASYGDTAAVNDWIFQKPGADIDTPENLAAAGHLAGWIDEGYFTDDVNSMDYSQMMSRFVEGESLFMFNGDWESGNLDAQMPGGAGFFLMPPLEAGGAIGAMSAPNTYGIAATAEHAECAAFFLNWAATDEQARTIGVETGGSHPMGPADGFMPEVAEDSVTAATLAAGATVSEADGAMDFIANATGSIYAQSWTPNLQKLVAGEQTPEGLLESVQADYESQVGD
ncbi:ABC transporter substrate-binding protein [Glycomyces dulcitolivorans]|uniref:ABC transporter substrate-binding protein n=1 Tax=Glycomyces dulcitolivorans TaxID=2200759 RepID=UPI000DD2F28B|nr:extracellular solute-binding protein [Glycomyces dulcitolivorans]